MITEKKVRGTDYITGEAPLSRLHDVLRHMLNRNGDIKTAIIPDISLARNGTAMTSIATNGSRSLSVSDAQAGWNALPKEYAIPDVAPSLEVAQAYCQRLARSHYENFSVATWFLPERLRQHFFNVYAYCRISDDLGDEVGDTSASLALLDQWNVELDACYCGRSEASCIRRLG